jgi:hypothetical protein
VDDEGIEPVQQLPRLDGTSADGDDGRRPSAARLADETRLELAERRLAPLGEDLRDRSLGALDLLVDVDERPTEALRDLGTDGRLAGSHEADQHDVPCRSIASAHGPVPAREARARREGQYETARPSVAAAASCRRQRQGGRGAGLRPARAANRPGALALMGRCRQGRHGRDAKDSTKRHGRASRPPHRAAGNGRPAAAPGSARLERPTGQGR